MPAPDLDIRVATPPTHRPLVVFDGDCSFCKRQIARWQSATAERIDYEPYQTAAVRFPEIPLPAFQQAVHLIEPSGAVTRGAEAVFRTLALSGEKRWPLWLYMHVPGFAFVAQVAYEFVARHRNLMDKLDRSLVGPHTTQPTCHLTRFIFLRLLGIVYLIAFASLWMQIDGLVGSKGILPVQEYLTDAHAQFAAKAYWLLPTLLWFNAGDAALHWLCGVGVVLSVLLILDIALVPVLALLWAFYLSLAVGGQTFLNFQWDALLLEAGFLAIFFAPWQFLPRPSREARPSRIVLWLLRWLAFRVMFFSGVVKLTWGDPTWRHLTALDYHYQTQPLPTWIGWYFHHLPPWFQTLSVLFMFYAELAAPLMIFGPRRVRLLGFWSILLLQVLIMATGNFGFFNILTLTLCITLLDDVFWPKPWRCAIHATPGRRAWRWPVWITAPLAMFILGITSMQLAEAFNAAPIAWPAPLQAVSNAVDPFRSINSYGLFREMTLKRPEIMIEGSDDGQTWQTYGFKWKPGDVNRAPAFCEPYMPRLDWQMWFAALNESNNGRDLWLYRFAGRLLQGSPPVLGLLGHNPFANHPPQYVRAVMYEYSFTSLATHRKTGAWWRADELYELFTAEPTEGGFLFHIPAQGGREPMEGKLLMN